MNNLDHALEYVKIGWAVLPLHSPNESGNCSCGNKGCKSVGKHPRIDEWQNNATTDENIIRDWWTKWLDANMGINLEKSGIIAIDLDRHKPEADGLAKFEIFEDENGKIPDTPRAITGGEGQHIIFKAPNIKLKGKLTEGIDIKAKGYIVAPPSNHSSGNRYKWHIEQSPFEVAPAECPQWLLELIKAEEEDISAASDQDNREYPESNANKIIERCHFMRHWAKDAYNLPEPDWYCGIGILCRTVESPEIIHRYSNDYPDYDCYETEKKIAHALKDMTGATTCKGIRDHCGSDYCKDCKFNGHIRSPIVLGYKPEFSLSCDNTSFPVEALPTAFREYAEEASRVIKAPVDYIGLTLIAVASGLIGNSKIVRINSSWEEPASLYCALVGKPGIKKSPFIKLIKKFLRPLEEILNEKYKNKLQSYKKEILDYEVQKKNKLEEPVKPSREILYVDDSTVEGLIQAAIKNPNGVMIISDELTLWIRSMNQYKGSNGTDRSYFLQALNAMDYKKNRSGEDLIIVKNIFHTILGGIQPDVLYELKDKCKINDGLIDRILFVFPEDIDDGTISNAGINEELGKTLDNCLKNLFYLREKNNQEAIELEREAFELFNKWSVELKAMSRSANSILLGFLAKQTGFTARLALIIHCVKVATEEISGSKIPEDTMRQAIALSRYFIKQAEKVYGILSQNQSEKNIFRIIERAKTKNLECLTPRIIQQMNILSENKANNARDFLLSMQDYGLGIWSADKDAFILFSDV